MRRLSETQLRWLQRIYATGGRVEFMSGLYAHAYLRNPGMATVPWQTVMALERRGVLVPQFELVRGFRQYTGWVLNLAEVPELDREWITARATV